MISVMVLTITRSLSWSANFPTSEIKCYFRGARGVKAILTVFSKVGPRNLAMLSISQLSSSIDKSILLTKFFPICQKSLLMSFKTEIDKIVYSTCIVRALITLILWKTLTQVVLRAPTIVLWYSITNEKLYLPFTRKFQTYNVSHQMCTGVFVYDVWSKNSRTKCPYFSVVISASFQLLWTCELEKSKNCCSWQFFGTYLIHSM